MKQSEANEQSKQQALKWLAEKPRTNEEIAEKMVESINITYDMTVRHFNLDLRNKMFEALCRPPGV